MQQYFSILSTPTESLTALITILIPALHKIEGQAKFVSGDVMANYQIKQTQNSMQTHKFCNLHTLLVNLYRYGLGNNFFK